MPRHLQGKFRNFYILLVGKRKLQEAAAGRRDLGYWQNRMFTTAIFYALPLSLFALIPSIILEWQEGHTNIAIFNIIVLAAVAFISTTKLVTMVVRKVFIACIIVLFAVVAMAFMGSFTMGCIYLFPLSIYVALQFSSRAAYLTVALNFAICMGFAGIMWLRPVNLPQLFANVSLNHWLIYSVNFVFMDLVVVILIRQILTGLSRTMARENFLYRNLQKESQESRLRNELIKESEAHYRALFFQSPLPKWILDTESLSFLQVNDAALSNYGYTEQEFLQMKLHDIHLEGHLPEFLRATKISPEVTPAYTTRHVRKDGELLHVEVRRRDIFFRGKKARLLIATDITEQVNHTEAVQLKNKKLHEIAYEHSHVVRVPLANIIGLTRLMGQTETTAEQAELLDYMGRSVHQLDDAVKRIVQHVEAVLPE